jgi:hypothetical protein
MQPASRDANHFLQRSAGGLRASNDTVVLVLLGAYDFESRYQIRSLLHRFAGSRDVVLDFSEVRCVHEAIVAELNKACTVRILHGRTPITVVTLRAYQFGEGNQRFDVAAELGDVACCSNPNIVFDCVLASPYRRRTPVLGSVR